MDSNLNEFDLDKTFCANYLIVFNGFGILFRLVDLMKLDTHFSLSSEY